MKNWAGNYSYRARQVVEPRSLGELSAVVRAARETRVSGSRHSFNDIGDTDGVLVSLAALPPRFEIDTAARAVTVDGAVRYGDISRLLDEAGLALHNLASLPHISVAGAVATGTHGSGLRSQSLAGAVVGLELMTGDGEMVQLDKRSDDAFEGAVVSLGALGVVTALKLAVEPSYDMRQVVYENLPLSELEAHFDELAGAAQSVSFFTSWRRPVVDQLWVKTRDLDGALPADIYGARQAIVNRHPIAGMPADACTPQLGVIGPWYARLPHFRLDHTPSSGDELQSEYFVARQDVVPAFHALLALREEVAASVQVSEIRTIAADEMWLSPAYGRDSVAFHFTWEPDASAVMALLPRIEAALEPFGPRPHWAKLFTMSAATTRARYSRFNDFVALMERYDPAGKFRNGYLRRLLSPD